MRALKLGLSRFLFLARAEQHHERPRSEKDRHGDQTQAKRRERQARDLAPMHHKGNAGPDEHERQRDGEHHLCRALMAGTQLHLARIGGLEAHLIGRLRRSVIRFRQLNAVRTLRLPV